ncbi:MAG TPA: hypothetical protein ENN67_06485 [Firmicutes bacterium]|nr:hypothetical protein [Bacillota bacterium]
MTFDPEKLRESLLSTADETDAEEEVRETEQSDEEILKPAASPDPPHHHEAPPENVRGRLIGASDDPAGRLTANLTQTQEHPVNEKIEPKQKLDSGDKNEERETLDALRSALVSRQADEQAEKIEAQRARSEKFGTGEAGKIYDKNSKREKREKNKRRYVPPPPPSPLSKLAIFGGAVSLCAAVIAAILTEDPKPAFALAFIGIVLSAGFISFNRLWVKENLTSRSTRYGANVAIVILSLLGIMILVNVLGYKHYYRFDMSSRKAHTLTPQSLQVIEDINRAGETVTIIAFVPVEGGYRDEVQKLADKYLYLSKNLKFSFVDPDIKRDLTESKGINRFPSILFELGERRTVITDIDEAWFTSALIGVRKTESPIVSFLSGHNEPNPYGDKHDENSLGLLRERLEMENFQVNILRIPEANGVPPETKVLIVVNPRSSLHQMEIEAIKEYMLNGGSMICLLEPGNDAGLGEILQLYGIAANNDIVLDDERNFFGEISSPVLQGNFKHPITSPPGAEDGLVLVFPRAGSLGLSTMNRLPDIVIDSLVRSHGSSWSETSDVYEFDPEVNKKDSLNMAYIASVPPGSTQTVTVGDEQEEIETGAPGISELIVVNDASFALNANIDRYDNSDFILNAINHLAMNEDLIALRTPTDMPQPMEVTKAQARVVFVFSVLLVPLFVAGLGGFVWWRRR